MSGRKKKTKFTFVLLRNLIGTGNVSAQKKAKDIRHCTTGHDLAERTTGSFLMESI